MMKYTLGAALLTAFVAPVSAAPTATTTTEEYYVVRDPATKKCTVATSKPTSTTTVVVGDSVYKSRTEAEGAVTKVCTD